MFSRFRTSALLALLATLAPLSAQAQERMLAPTVARLDVGAPAVQTFDLPKGAHWVSLYVRPEDPSMEAVFRGHTGNFVVRDLDGASYTSLTNHAELAEWRVGQAYRIDVPDRLRFEVSGSLISPTTEVVLQAGWNEVAFLHSEPLAVETALASIAANVIEVAAQDGRVYPAAGNQPQLRTLEPGRGYRIRVSQTDTLVYAPTPVPQPPPAPRPPSAPEPPPAPEPTDFTVDSLDDALVLTGLTVGQTVRVLGYYEPGDGGGGVFEVRDSGATPDGGTVFVPLEHQSGGMQDVLPHNATLVLPSVPDGEDVVFGTLTLLVEDLVDRGSVEVGGHHLHGHRYANKWALRPLISYDGGVFRDSNVIHRFLGDSDDGRLTFRYRHTTSGLRLHRQDVGSTLNVHWFGGRPASLGPNWTGTTDVQPLLCQAINVAQAMNAAAPGSVTDVLLPALDTYDYFGTIEIPDGLTLRGAAGTELVTVTNDLGHTYRPVRIRAAHTRLRLMDGEALRHLRMLKDPSDPHYLPRDAKDAVATRVTGIWPVHNAQSMAVEDLVLDGNWQGNMQAWDDGWGAPHFENWLRNAPGWTGIIANNHGGKGIPDGQHVTVRNVAVVGYAATGLLGKPGNTWTLENVLVGNSLYNHALYQTDGDHTNLTIVGFSWGNVWRRGSIRNFVYERGAPNPVGRYTDEVLNIRGGDSYDDVELAGQGFYSNNLDEPLEMGTKVVGFYADLRGSDASIVFDGLGRDVVLRGVSAAEPARVVANTEKGVGIYTESGNGYQKALYPRNRIQDVVLYNGTTGDAITGGPHQASIIGGLNVTDSVIRNVRTERLNGQDGHGNRVLTLAARRRNHPAWGTPQNVLYDQIRDAGPTLFIAAVSADPDAAGNNVFIRASSFNNTSSTLFKGRDGTGRASTFQGDLTKLRVYMDSVSFNLPDGYISNFELFFAMSRFRNSTDRRSGRTSEARLTLRASDFSGREAVVPLGLFWAPQSRDHVEFSGPGASAISSWEIVDADGNTLGEDQRNPHLRIRLSESLGGRTLTVDAAVRPWEDGVEVPESLGQ